MASNRPVRSPSSSRRSIASANRLDEVLNLQQAFSPPRPSSSTRRASTSRLGATSPPRMDSPASVAEEQTPLASISDAAGAFGDGNVASSPPFRSHLSITVAPVSPTAPNAHPANTTTSMSLPPISLLTSGPQSTPPSSLTFTPRVVRGGEASSTRQATRSLRATSSINTRSLSVTPSNTNATRANTSGMIRNNLTTPPTSFRRPTYLNNSCLSELLISEIPPQLPPNRFRFDELPRDFITERYTKTRPVQARGEESEEDIIDNSAKNSGLRGTLTPPLGGPLRLPTRWSTGDHSSDLSISDDGTVLSFNGPPSSTDKDAAAARTNHYVPPACGIYYYEVEVLNPGMRGHISVGYSASEVPLNRLPGWEEHSWGYHGDDGHVFASEGEGKPYGPTYTSGDVIGCGIDFTLHKMFYTKNGSYLGLVFDRVGIERRLFPSVGLRTPRESVKANFGQEEFRFDIDAYVYQERTRVWRTIQSIPLTLTVDLRTHQSAFTSLTDKTISSDNSQPAHTPSSETKGKLDEIVMSYLNHHGYCKSYQAMKKTMNASQVPQVPQAPTTLLPVGDDMDLDTDVEEAATANTLQERKEERDLRNRIKILKAVQSGHIDTALTETQKHYPSVLEADGGFMKFRLRCRKLVELIIESAELLKKIQAERSAVNTNGHSAAREGSTVDGVFDMEMEMDVGLTSSTRPSFSNGGARNGSNSEEEVAMEVYHQAFGKALAFGQSLQGEYRENKREEVVSLFKSSASLMAFTDPLRADQEICGLASHESRIELVNELNQAILAALGRPAQSTVERLYLHTSCVIRQLGLLGEGAAAFANARSEVLGS